MTIISFKPYFPTFAGFRHEQSRNDRKDYIEVDYDAIKEVQQDRGIPRNWLLNQYKKCSLTKHGKRWGCKRINNYDLESILHYPNTYLDTPTPKLFKAKVKCNNRECNYGQRKELSPLDVADIEVLYNCSKY